MTPKEVRNAIISRYLKAYKSSYDIAIDNKKFTPPVIPTPYARISVKFNDGFQQTQGRENNRKFIRVGIVYIQVFTPKDKGTDDNDDMANDALNLFDGARIDNLWFYNGRVNTIGPDDTYYQQQAVIEFEFEDIR